MAHLWGIIQCSMRQFSPEACFLHADIVRMGWKDFFAIEIERIKQYRPRGVILHCWRGQIPVRGSNGEMVPKQSLFMRREMERQPLAARLLTNMDREVFDAVEEMKKYALTVSYDGPPATGSGMLHAEEYIKEQPTAALMEGLNSELGDAGGNFDGYIIDGAGDKDEGSARGRYIDAIDGLFEPRLPTGVEHMAGRNAEHWGDRMSLTLAGIQTGPAGGRSGKYDPTVPMVVEADGLPRLHRDFAPLASITGEKIVLDIAGGITQADRDRRAGLIAASGCSPCIPTWSFARNPYREGFFVPAATPAPPAPPAPVTPVAVGS